MHAFWMTSIIFNLISLKLEWNLQWKVKNVVWVTHSNHSNHYITGALKDILFQDQSQLYDDQWICVFYN